MTTDARVKILPTQPLRYARSKTEAHRLELPQESIPKDLKQDSDIDKNAAKKQ